MLQSGAVSCCLYSFRCANIMQNRKERGRAGQEEKQGKKGEYDERGGGAVMRSSLSTLLCHA
jgi:hypothetical protein